MLRKRRSVRALRVVLEARTRGCCLWGLRLLFCRLFVSLFCFVLFCFVWGGGVLGRGGGVVDGGWGGKGREGGKREEGVDG